MTEDLVDPLRGEVNLLLLSVLVHLFPFGSEIEANPPNVWLVSATTSMTLFRVHLLVRVIRTRVHLITSLTDLLAFAKIVDMCHSLSWLSL